MLKMGFYAVIVLFLAPIISYSNTELNCKVLNDGKQVGQKNVQVQDSLLTSVWSKKNIEAYSNDQFRATLCSQFGHGKEAGLHDINQRYGRSHNIQRHHKASFDNNCTLNCRQLNQDGNSSNTPDNKQTNQIATAGRIGGLLAGP